MRERDGERKRERWRKKGRERALEECGRVIAGKERYREKRERYNKNCKTKISKKGKKCGEKT